ncbi:glycosyltransferase [Sphingobium sp. CR2-8]|uniref:glycosyltransferase n=1 Tax=Sphingobium sp. CR2-8 TaxID=1306534 RepID=UPI002DBE1D3C|nr:glycosyltransferase [Sphingobium sp. CR2-8]MEC3912795.1 glycosyltransferase [Sphingobium sp. CR2-8]
MRRSGAVFEAAQVYERAIELRPGMATAWLGLGIARKAMGMRSAAIAAFVETLRLDPSIRNARAELVTYGARGEQGRLAGRRTSMADAIKGLTLSIREATRWQRELDDLSVFLPNSYHDYRTTLAVRAPIDMRASLREPLHILIRAQGVPPSAIRGSLQSLLAQSLLGWTATVLADEGGVNHPVASLAHVDPRVRFRTRGQADETFEGWTLLIDAGTVLHPLALDWFDWTRSTDCAAAYCDHDRVERDWKHGPHYSDPVLQPVYDRYWFNDAAIAPAAILLRQISAEDHTIAEYLSEAAGKGSVAHIPLPLASRSGQWQAGSVGTTISVSDIDNEARICVIIPTRDNPALLKPCIDSLLRFADRPDQIDIRIVSNRTALPESKVLLRELARREGTDVIDFDEPFNWSRANNIAARDCTADILLFLNDDTEMQSQAWDGILKQLLARDDEVGAVGARLHYPQGGIQHAGIMFGLDEGGPQHEGRWQESGSEGPAGRWSRSHASAAVTGAFMAMPRKMFDQLAGFDEQNFAIAYNDVDMCLRVREAGALVIYCPDIIMIHHESVSRGSNLTAEMIDWDQAELESLHRRWGREIFLDPAYNPNFTRTGYPFDGYRQPSSQEVAEHVKRSAKTKPWSVKRQH